MQREREKTIIKDLFIKKSQKYYKNKRNNSNVNPQMRSYFLDILIILIFLILFIILIIFIILIVFINLIILIREGCRKSKWKFKMAFAIRRPIPPP